MQDQLSDALALRQRIDDDIQRARTELSVSQAKLTAMRGHGGALELYEQNGSTEAEVNNEIARIGSHVQRALDARYEADRRVTDARRTATAAYLDSQSKRLAGIRKSLRSAAQAIVAASAEFDAMEGEMLGRGLNAPSFEVRDDVLISGPRCTPADLAEHMKNYLNRGTA